MDRIDQKLLHSVREHSHFLLLFLDLDGFKLVNDQLGHHVGDDLLKDVANRIVSAINEPVEVLGDVLQVGVSIGIAISPPMDTHLLI